MRRLWRRIRAAFAWKQVRDSGVYVYEENTITGERRAIPYSLAYQPLDREWLANRPGPTGPKPLPRQGSAVRRMT